jgi:hypothetical protein
MKTVLICPSGESVSACFEGRNFVEIPFLGKSILERWLEYLSGMGRSQVIILAIEFPERIREMVHRGERWGLQLEVIPERKELSIVEVKDKYNLRQEDEVIRLDHLPTIEDENNLTETYDGLCKASNLLLKSLNLKDRIGLKQWQPGVWVGLRTKISARTKITPPCWIGNDVHISAESVIGPDVIIEDRCLVEGNNEIAKSIIFPETFIGPGVDVTNSIVNGNTIVNVQTASVLQVPNSYIVSSLSKARNRNIKPSVLGRVAAFFVMLLSLPAALIYILISRLRYKNCFTSRVAVRPNPNSLYPWEGTLVYYELKCANRILKRWPQLINVILGEFSWVGNPLLSPSEAVWLTTEFDRLWFSVSSGIISLSDAEDCVEGLSYEARAHAAYYSVQRNVKMDLAILWRSILLHLLGVRLREENASVSVEEEVIEF